MPEAVIDQERPGGRPISLSQRQRINGLAIQLADIVAVLLVQFGLRTWILDVNILLYRSEGGSVVPTPTGVDHFLLLAAACLIYFRFVGQYRQRRTIWDETRPMFRAFLIVGLIDMLLLLAGQIEGWFIGPALSWVLLLVMIALGRVVTKRILLSQGYWQMPTVIIGGGRLAQQAADALQKEAHLGFEVQGFLAPEMDNSAGQLEVAGKSLPVRPLNDAAAEALLEKDAPHVVVALDDYEAEFPKRLINRLSMRTFAVDIMPPVWGMPLYGMEVNHLFAREFLLLRVRNNLARRGPRLLKRTLDLVGASALLLALSPVLLCLAIAVRLSGKQIVFGHTRIGQDGKPFKCLKFRSMVPNASEVLRELLANSAEARAEWERDFKLKNDPRITKVGAIIRKTSLDELPQLFNVLRGEMSLVGPRPIVQDELVRYGDSLGHYLEVKPGITGLWQISGRNDVDYENRVFLDAWYAKNWSLWYDIVILLRTVLVVLRKQGAY